LRFDVVSYPHGHL